MITIAGKTILNGLPTANNSVQVCIVDRPNGIVKWSDVKKTDENGRFQYSPVDILDLHQNLSKDAKILVAAWADDGDRTSTHDYLGTSVLGYNGEALVLADVELTEKGTCDYVLQNSHVSVKEGESISYTPIFVAPTQLATFEEEYVFMQNNVTAVYYKQGDSFVQPFELVYNTAGDYELVVGGENALGVTFSDTAYFHVDEREDYSPIEMEDFSIEEHLALFSPRGRGIKDGSITLSMFYSSKFTPQKLTFYVDDEMVREVTDMSIPVITLVPGQSTLPERVVKVVAEGVDSTTNEAVTTEYEKAVPNFKTIEGDIAVSFDPNTGKHTAALNVTNGDEISEILWQIVYKSTVVQKVVSVTGKEDIALINILYQDYTDPSVRSIEFELLRPGDYTVKAYIINTAGVFFEAEENVFVPGGDDSEDDIQVGDSIVVGCVSNHGEVPIISVHRLSRDGYEEVVNAPMDHAYDKMFFYTYTVEQPDSFYIFKAADSLVVKKVGEPRGCTLAYAKDKTSGRQVEYRLEDFNGNVVDSGYMDDTGYGIYYKVLPETVHGVLVVGKTYKVI